MNWDALETHHCSNCGTTPARILRLHRQDVLNSASGLCSTPRYGSIAGPLKGEKGYSRFAGMDDALEYLQWKKDLQDRQSCAVAGGMMVQLMYGKKRLIEIKVLDRVNGIAKLDSST